MTEPILAPMPRATKPTVPMVLFVLASLFGGISLLLGIRAAIADVHQNQVRERDRIESDLADCERSNDNRRDQITLANAQVAFVDGVLSGVADYAQMSEAEMAVLDQILLPARKAITDAIAAIEITDCRAVVPGAKESP